MSVISLTNSYFSCCSTRNQNNLSMSLGKKWNVCFLLLESGQHWVTVQNPSCKSSGVSKSFWH